MVRSRTAERSALRRALLMRPTSTVGKIIWIATVVLAMVVMLAQWGLFGMSVAVHLAASLGDLGDRVHSVVGQVLMASSLVAMLIAWFGAAAWLSAAVLGVTVAAVEKRASLGRRSS